MSNLIRYIIQEDPEKQMRKKTWEKPTYSSIVAPREEIEASKKRSQNLLESALSSYNTKQTPTPWAKKQSGNLLERINSSKTSGPKRIENNSPDLNRSSVGDIALEGAKGVLQGTLGGIEHGINSASLGLYDFINDAFFDGGYEKRQKALEELAKSANLDKAYKYANYAIEAGFDALPISKGAKKISQSMSKISKKIK